MKSVSGITPARREQLHAHLFTTLTGKEPGLVGYWNFDDGTATDLAPAQNHGEFIGNVKFTPAKREYQLVAGKIIAADNQPIAHADILLFSGGQKIATSRTDADGNYFCLLTATVTGACDVQAAKNQLTGWRFDLSLHRGARSAANLQRSGNLNISGSVRTMDDQQPHEDVEVQVFLQGQRAETNSPPSLTARTDAPGDFKFLTADRGNNDCSAPRRPVCSRQ